MIPQGNAQGEKNRAGSAPFTSHRATCRLRQVKSAGHNGFSTLESLQSDVMLELSRRVRFCVNDPVAQLPATPGRRSNTFAAWPAMHGLGRYYELNIRCRGEADAQTGYFINIRQIDQAVRDHALPLFQQAVAQPDGGATVPLGRLLRQVTETLQPPLRGTVIAVELCLTPTYALTMRSNDMASVVIEQQYEFSAAHRLHVPELTETENRDIFGKCNNPAGHGHNYRVRVAVRVGIDEHGRSLSVQALDDLVDEHVIQPLDHKHLNLDVPQFADLNPSVENIARVIWGMLEKPLSALPQAPALEAVSVWETQKTVCTYRGE